MALLRRTFSAVILLGGAALIMFMLPSLVGVAILFLMAITGLLEFYSILRAANIPAFRILGTTAGILLLATTYLSLNIQFFTSPPPSPLWKELPLLVLTLVVFSVFLRQFPQKNNTQPLPTISCTLLGLVYVPFLIMFFFLLAFRWTPVAPMAPLSSTAAWLLLYLVVVVKSSDVGAYFVGSLIGRHKLIPRISPGKTWEGLAGGLATGTLASVLYVVVTRKLGADLGTVSSGQLTLTTADVWILGFCLAAIGVLGDLFESLLKRSAGVKDSGCLFPGMGGILDVLDSLLFAAPVLYFYLRWFAYVV